MSAMCGIRPPLQGSGLFALQTQGVALGCDSASLWDSKSMNEMSTFDQLGWQPLITLWRDRFAAL